jgi:GAF domain-containing protein
VFDTIAQSAARLCDAEFCHVFRFDGALVHFVAGHGLSAAALEEVNRAYPMAPGRGSASARAIMTCEMAHIPDVLADPEYGHGAHAKIMAFRSIFAVPMMREGVPIGAIAVARPQIGLFPERQLALVNTFAEQAVIAIENVRLFTELGDRNRELTEALEQQTATSDILRVISQSPTDAQPVFDHDRRCRAQTLQGGQRERVHVRWRADPPRRHRKQRCRRCGCDAKGFPQTTRVARLRPRERC